MSGAPDFSLAALLDAVPRPGVLYNPLTATRALKPISDAAGPLGLIVWLPLLPAVLLVARRWPRGALLGGGLAWLLLTLRAEAALLLLFWLLLASGWLLLLAQLRARGVLSRRAMVALVWLGLHALVAPLWWSPAQPWYAPLSPLAPLHMMGFAYFLLRYIAWGVALADEPQQPLRPVETLCWLLYPPSMRVAPFLQRDEFLPLLDRWDPRRSPAWRGGARRFGLCLLGAGGLGLAVFATPTVISPERDFFAHPEAYPTAALVRLFYLVPIRVYLLLWTYNQLAQTLGLWLGLPVPENFDGLPRATSVRDFWRRWNITVGAWLRKYFYIPLGGNRRHVTLNYLLVFAYCGVWHGPSWSFLAWGVSQGVALAVQRWWDLWRARGGVPPKDAAAPPSRATTIVCWLLTMHYQAATIFMFTDFEYLGVRFARELWRRALS